MISKPVIMALNLADHPDIWHAARQHFSFIWDTFLCGT